MPLLSCSLSLKIWLALEGTVLQQLERFLRCQNIIICRKLKIYTYRVSERIVLRLPFLGHFFLIKYCFISLGILFLQETVKVTNCLNFCGFSQKNSRPIFLKCTTSTSWHPAQSSTYISLLLLIWKTISRINTLYKTHSSFFLLRRSKASVQSVLRHLAGSSPNPMS